VIPLLHVHVYADESLFEIAEITNLDYTATFKKDGLYIYKGAELIHYTSKCPNSTSSWTLPIECPLIEANAVGI